MATKRVGNMRMAHYFHGTNAGAKLAAAIADCASTGGIVDARGFEGTHTISQNIFASLSTLPLTLLLGPAQFHVTTTQTIAAAAGLRIIGCATGGGTPTVASLQSEFIWDGANGGTVFILDRTRDSLFQQFSIKPGAGTIGIGARLDHLSAPAGFNICADDRWKTIYVGRSTTAFQIGNSSVANNSEHVFEDCHIYDVGTHGYYINNGQSKTIQIIGGHIDSRTSGIYQNSGSFRAERVILNSNTIDFTLNSSVDILLIQGCESENSTGFIEDIGAASGPFAVTCIGNSFIPNNLRGDGHAIVFQKTGVLNLEGNDFSGGAFKSGENIYAQGSNAGACRVISKGNIYGDPTFFSANAQAANADIISLGDTAWGSGNVVVQMPVLLGSGYNGALTLANGANNDITASGAWNSSRLYRITGPSAGFSISGFTGGVPGREIKVFNTTAQQMTIKNLTGSSSSNQIQTLTGADVVLRTGTSAASFFYDGTLAKWILVSTN